MLIGALKSSCSEMFGKLPQKYLQRNEILVKVAECWCVDPQKLHFNINDSLTMFTKCSEQFSIKMHHES